MPERLPRILVATATALESPCGDDSRGEGWMVRDLDLAALVRLSEGRHPWLALDVDSVEGMNSDDAAVRFALRRLGVNAIVSRRPAAAVLASELGAVGLLRVFAYDSTGLRRSLEPIAHRAGIGLVISPGIVLPYIDAEQRRTLPRPLVAYGLIDRPAQAASLLATADSVVVRPALAELVRGAQQAAGAREAAESTSGVGIDTRPPGD